MSASEDKPVLETRLTLGDLATLKSMSAEQNAVDILRLKAENNFPSGNYQTVELLPNSDKDSLQLSYTGNPTTGIGIYLDLSKAFVGGRDLNYLFPAHNLLGSSLEGGNKIIGADTSTPFLSFMFDLVGSGGGKLGNFLGSDSDVVNFDLVEFGSAQLSRLSLTNAELDRFVNGIPNLVTNNVILPDGSRLSRGSFGDSPKEIIESLQSNLSSKGVSVYESTLTAPASTDLLELVIPSTLASKGDLKFVSNADNLSNGGETVATQIEAANAFVPSKTYPIGVLPVKRDQNSLIAVLEYSDSSVFPSLVRPAGYFDEGFDQSFANSSPEVEIINDVIKSDVDYVAFEVPAGSTFEHLLLDDFALLDDTTKANSTLDFKLSKLQSDGTLVAPNFATGTFGLDDDGKTLFEIAGVSPKVLGEGDWVFEIRPSTTFPSTQEAAYQFKFGPGLDIDMSAVKFDLQEDQQTDFSLPLPSKDKDGKQLSWHVPNLPSGMKFASGVITGKPAANYNTVGKGASSVQQAPLISLTASSEGISKTFQIPFNVASTPDAPSLSQFADTSAIAGTEDASLEISYAALNTKVGSGYSDPDGDAAQFLLKLNPSFASDYNDLDVQVRIGNSGLSASEVVAKSTLYAAPDTLSAGKSLYVVPEQNYNTNLQALNDAFLLSVKDSELGQEFGAQPLSLVFAPQPDAPILPTQSVGPFTEGKATFTTGVLASTDPDYKNGQVPSNAHVFAQTNQIPGFALSPNGGWAFNALDNAYDNLAEGEERIQTVQYKVSDAGFTGNGNDQPPISGSFDLKVIGTNDAPQPVLPSPLTASITEGTPVTRHLPKNDSEGSPVSSNTFYDKLQYSVASEPTKPQGFNLNDSDGEFMFDPSGIQYDAIPKGATKTETVTLDVVDAKGATSKISLDFPIKGENDAPTLTSIQTIGIHSNGQALQEEQRYQFSVSDLRKLSNAADADKTFGGITTGTDSQLTFKLSSIDSSKGQLLEVRDGAQDLPIQTNGSFLLDPAKTYAWEPAPNLNGLQDSFSVKANDGLSDSANPVTVKFDLTPIDDAPGVKPALNSSKYVYSFSEESTDSVIDLLVENLDPVQDNAILDFAPGGNPNNKFSLVKSTGAGTDNKWQLKFLGADFEAPGSSKEAQSSFTASILSYDVDLKDGKRGLQSVAKDFTVKLKNKPDQILGLSAVGLGNTLTPGDKSIKLDLNYKVRGEFEAGDAAPVINGPQKFNATLSYSPSLTVASDTLHSKIQTTNLAPANGRKRIGIASSELNAFTSQAKSSNNGQPLGGLTFTRADDPTKAIELTSYSFDLNLDLQNGFESLTDSIAISPQVDNFIKPHSQKQNQKIFDLSDFDTPLTFNTKAKTVKLDDSTYSAFAPLDYTSSNDSFSSLKLTSKNDTVHLDRPLNVELEDGDDKINFKLLDDFANSFRLEASLGKGDDTVVLPSKSSLTKMGARSQAFNVKDFELSFDSIETDDGLIQRRDQVIAFIDKQKNILDIDFAPLAIDLDQKEPSLASVADKVFSEATPLITSSISLDPGSASNTVQLEVKLVDQPASARLKLLDDTASFGAWTWSIPSDPAAAHTALLSFNASSGLTPLQAQGQLRKAAANIGLISTSASDFTTNLKVNWKATGNAAPRDVLTKQISVNPSSALPASGSVDYANSQSAVNLALSLPNQQSRKLTTVHATDKADRIVLISEAFNDKKTDSVFANDGNDLVEVGDGDAAHGEFGDDRLIAMAGSSTTQLFGGKGNDLLIGAQGDDLFAGSGNDVLAVRGKNNFLWGGAGADTFVLHDDSIQLLSPGTGLSRVKDFNTSDDRINIHATGVDSFGDIVLTAFGRRSTKISFDSSVNHSLGSDSFAVIENVRHDELTSSNFSFTQNSLVADNLSRVASIDQFI